MPTTKVDQIISDWKAICEQQRISDREVFQAISEQRWEDLKELTVKADALREVGDAILATLNDELDEIRAHLAASAARLVSDARVPGQSPPVSDE